MLKKQKIMVFGGTGSLGRALLHRLGGDNEMALYSRDEAKHWTIKNQIGPNSNTRFIVGDIRDPARVEESILNFKPSIIIIAAALKQVDTCELSPHESVQTNVLGIKNIIDAVTRHHEKLQRLEAVLMVSTDKACAPTNVYGMCKAIAERMVTSVASSLVKPKFIGVRYGNVLESRGSIIPLFRHQAETQDYFTVTHPEMTRFIMTLDQSIDLIEATTMGAKSGEIWLPKLHAMKIIDLAEVFARRYKKTVKIIGMRPGEKLHEDLVSEPESVRVIDENGYYKLSPAFANVSIDAKSFHYASNHDLMTFEQLDSYLDSIGIFSKSMSEFVGRQIEEIVDVK